MKYLILFVGIAAFVVPMVLKSFTSTTENHTFHTRSAMCIQSGSYKSNKCQVLVDYGVDPQRYIQDDNYREQVDKMHINENGKATL
ncbi:hypothetical protein [Alteromonas sp. 14N.309.X.WAT.G.H12]|uniref:hypothetical protein n=1 Tax=Alteromonas sp. 14N.309.X.WAT.G.H12 TaxID=3120824 RepID=UPI002FD14335